MQGKAPARGGGELSPARVSPSTVRASVSCSIEHGDLAEELAAARAERAALSAHGAVLTSLLIIKNAQARALTAPDSQITAPTAQESMDKDRRSGALRALLESGALDVETRERLQCAAAMCDAGASGGDIAAAQQRAAHAAAARMSSDQVQRLQTAYRHWQRRVRAAKAHSSAESMAVRRQLTATSPPAKNEPDAAYIRPWHEKAESHLS